MILELGLGCHILEDERYGPRPWALAAAIVLRHRLTRAHVAARATRTARHRRTLGGRQVFRCLAGVVAEFGRDEFAEVVEGFSMPSEISPQVAAGGLVHIGNLLLQRVGAGNDTFEIV